MLVEPAQLIFSIFPLAEVYSVVVASELPPFQVNGLSVSSPRNPETLRSTRSTVVVPSASRAVPELVPAKRLAPSEVMTALLALTALSEALITASPVRCKDPPSTSTP